MNNINNGEGLIPHFSRRKSSKMTISIGDSLDPNVLHHQLIRSKLFFQNLTVGKSHRSSEFFPRGDKVSMLTHTYPHKPQRKTKVTICNHQADSPLYVWPDV